MSEDRLVTRNEVRKMGLNVSSTQFIRYEDKKHERKVRLDPVKPAGAASAKVYYWLSNVQAFLAASTAQRKPTR